MIKVGDMVEHAQGVAQKLSSAKYYGVGIVVGEGKFHTKVAYYDVQWFGHWRHSGMPPSWDARTRILRHPAREICKAKQ